MNGCLQFTIGEDVKKIDSPYGEKSKSDKNYVKLYIELGKFALEGFTNHYPKI